MKRVFLIVVVMAALLGASPAQARLVYQPKDDTPQALLKAQNKNLKRAIYLCRNGRGEMRKWGCWAGSYVIRKNGQGWLRRERNETRAALAPKFIGGDWRGYLLRLVGPGVYHGCAIPLIGRESGGVVTKWNYGGSGAYGLGQALPASKMEPYGSDYMTNGVTQIRWMDDYVQKYGGWCGANSFQLTHGWY